MSAKTTSVVRGILLDAWIFYLILVIPTADSYVTRFAAQSVRTARSFDQFRGSCDRFPSVSKGSYKNIVTYGIGRGLRMNAASPKDTGILAGFRTQWNTTAKHMRSHPWTYISIPIVAALVGYVTNYVGVKMLFYPTKWTGIPLYRWENQPLGVIGWQGVVPAKRVAMASKMVDFTIAKLISIPEVFAKLQPKQIAKLLQPTVSSVVLRGLVPSPILRLFLARTARDTIQNVEQVLDVKHLVVSGMTSDPCVMGKFFQKVGASELKFLIDSGLGFGFLLGLLQMIQWMLFPANWTLPVGGAVVGYITNWIALKWVFEPLEPTKFGPFVLQGMFLRRQKEVSTEFSTFIAENILNSRRVWEAILEGIKSGRFREIVSRNVPLTGAGVASIITRLQEGVGHDGSHPLHAYTDLKLNLKNTLIERMNKMTPAEFENVLHPIFQEDELTLIIAGGVLGFAAGLLQWWLNVFLDKRASAKEAAKAAKKVTPETL